MEGHSISMKAENGRKNRKESRKRSRKKQKICYGILLAVIVILNFFAWNSVSFCDWYLAVIFPIWVNTYGRFTGMFPFSVGEWLIAAGVLLVLAAAVTAVVFAAAFVRAAIRKSDISHGLKRFTKGFAVFFFWVLAVVALIMTLNCFILYHASTFEETYFGGAEEEDSLEELLAVYNKVAQECNRLSALMERDEAGNVIYSGSRKGMAQEAIACMQKLGETYPRLAGYYPTPKPLLSSDFMCQQYMQGYYFPFSMEANYNDVMYLPNLPATMCHELAHLKGYIYEDEANFIGYLGCLESQDTFFQYAGYLSVLTYLNNDLYRAKTTAPESYQQAILQNQPVKVEEQVWEDNLFVTQEEWNRIHAEAFLDTDTVNQVTDVLVDTSLKINGVSDGKLSYSRVVRLLLQYYEKN